MRCAFWLGFRLVNAFERPRVNAWVARIERLVISAEIGWRKPSPHFFAAVARAVTCDVSSILFVGDDRANDYDAAIAAGMRAMLIGGL